MMDAMFCAMGAFIVLLALSLIRESSAEHKPTLPDLMITCQPQPGPDIRLTSRLTKESNLISFDALPEALGAVEQDAQGLLQIAVLLGDDAFRCNSAVERELRDTPSIVARSVFYLPFTADSPQADDLRSALTVDEAE
ncbi:hypothetical protein SSE37_01625 [Sagittula stellata E-37]|uniref:Uncharacterized protein n=2 Tax=Sagittula stellata TaxID=52603 RepID=A3K4L3_SAGS3|nr:hypothetical protein SSE37_01625 [Sagittula stellata E-37]